jgi:hypothetical protein
VEGASLRCGAGGGGGGTEEMEFRRVLVSRTKMAEFAGLVLYLAFIQEDTAVGAVN